MRTISRPRSATVRGFTMIELLAASALFLSGMLGLVAFQVSTQKASMRTGQRLTAAHLVANKMERLRGLSTAQLTSFVAAPPTPAVYDTSGLRTADPNSTGTVFYTVSSTFTGPFGTSAKYFDVQVHCTWPPDTQAFSVSLRSLVGAP